MATDRRELESRESEGISIALLIQSLDPSYRGCVTVGNRSSLLPGMCRGRESEFAPLILPTSIAVQSVDRTRFPRFSRR